MMRKVRFVFLLLFCFVTIACQSKETEGASEPENTKVEPNTEEEETIGNPTVVDVLGKDQGADIFLFNGIVFQNAKNVEWVSKIEFSLGEEVGEIKKQTLKPEEFEESAATKLPAGTKIYRPVDFPGPVYIILLNGEEIPYLGLLEG